MTFIGVEWESLHPDEAKRLRTDVNDIALAFYGLPVDLWKWSQYGRGLLARRHLKGTTREYIYNNPMPYSIGIEFVCASTFIGCECESLGPDEAKRLRTDVNDIVLAFYGSPVDFGKWSKYGRGLLARIHLKCTTRKCLRQ